MKLYTWFSGAWTAVLWFFTFGVARHLFTTFPRELAGAINRTLLPDYLVTAIVLGAFASIFLWRHRRGPRDTAAFILQIAAIAALSAIALVIRPAILLYAPGTPDFVRLHGISMALNLFSLIAAPTASLLVLARSKE